ncbi:MAG: hypothetical protein IKL80_03325 [Clostridia bacterium]|nr:hypothetical protein [Clostridia bacterium]
MKKLFSMLLAMLMAASIVTGCGPKEGKVETGANSDFAVNEAGNTVEDSSDLPDWTGKKLDLKLWWGQGTGSVKRQKKAENDVVTPELYRVTGVRYDAENSFDNGGETMDAKIAKIVAGGDWPDVIANCEAPILEKLIEADLVYDLKPYLEEYCPNIVEMARYTGINYLTSKRDDGAIYSLPYEIMRYSYVAPELSKDVLIKAETPSSPYGYVYVRDDILKQIYPNAKTQQELEDIYMANGGYTREEMMDVPINSPEEFFDFLYKIKALGVKEGNREVFPTFVADGLDNWSLLTNLGFLYGYNLNPGGDCNYFTYWDKETKSVEYMYKQPFFKEMMRSYTKLVQDGVASPDSIIDNRATFEQNVNNGLYAVLYGATTVPEPNTLNANLKAQGKNYQYRKVYLNIPLNHDKYLFSQGSPLGQNVVILKANLDENDLKQVLRFYDFAFSKAGQKLALWGPKSAGLFTEENGVRKFTDKDLEAQMVYGAGNEKDVYYGLANKAWPGYPFILSSEYDPKLVYEQERQPSLAQKYFNMGVIEAVPLTPATAPNVYTFNSYNVESTKQFWSARQTFEDALKKILIAKDDAEFEQLFNTMLTVAEQNGLTEEAKVELNKVYSEKINKDFMDLLK